MIWDFDGTLAQQPGLWGGCAIEVLDELEPDHQVELDQIRHELSNRFPWHAAEIPHPELTDPVAWWRHVVLSNHVPELERIAGSLGLGAHLERIFNSARIGYEKPHPEAYRHALAACGNPSRAWMVGDNVAADVQGAEALGIPAVLVRSRGEARHRADGLDGAVAILLSRGVR